MITNAQKLNLKTLMEGLTFYQSNRMTPNKIKTVPARVARQANIGPPSKADHRIKKLSGVNSRAPVSASIIPRFDFSIFIKIF